MPDPTLSEAIMEARASAPVGVVEYHTLEIRHPAFTNPIRVVRGFDTITARLEAAAPLDPSTYVEFMAMPFDLVPPDVTASGIPSMKITIDNVSRVIGSSIELALTSTDLLEVTYRHFLSTDLSAPQNNPPLTLKIMTVEMDAFKVTATAGFPTWQNRKFPTVAYTAEIFPGLVIS